MDGVDDATPLAMSLVAANDLAVRLGGRDVLHDVSLKVDAGEIVTLLGPNGSGKSTLLRAFLGAVPLRSGRIDRAPDLVIGYVPQRLTIDATLPLSVGRFLDLPVRAPRERRLAVLERVGAGGLERRAMSQLSGGQFQRVLLARALLATPNLLMLDEPTQGLDPSGEAAFYQLVDEVRRATDCGVLMASHDLHVVMSASDRVVCLNGHICCQGAPAQVASTPAYRELFGVGTRGALALYPHRHDHQHEADGSS